DLREPPQSLRVFITKSSFFPMWELVTMHADIKLGRLFGIEIGLHFSWLLIAALIVVVLMGRFSSVHPDWSDAVIWTTSIATAILFFVSLVAHELSHALVARLFHMPVRSITLFALGGIANIEKEALSAKAEFWMGIVGPITSAVIGLSCIWSAILISGSANLRALSPLNESLAWLGFINLAIAAFN